MAYTLKGAKALPNTYNTQWTEPDLTNHIVSTLFTDFKEIYLILENMGTTLYVNFEQFRKKYSTYNNTLYVFLQHIGNVGLETVPEIPSYKRNYVKYGHLTRLGYHRHLCERGYHHPDHYPRELLPDIKITRPNENTDLSLLHTHALLSVNGYIHQSDYGDGLAYIVDGGKSVNIAGNGACGLISFFDLGKLTKIPFTPTQFERVNEQYPMIEGLNIYLEEEIGDRFAFLVLGGYLMFMNEKYFYQSGEKRLTIKLNKHCYLNRINESRYFIDLEPLGLTWNEISPQAFNVEEACRDEVLLKYFQLSQSFLVILDNPRVFINTHFIRQTLGPGHYTAFHDLQYPLFVGMGRMAEYWKVKEGKRWAINAYDSYDRYYVYRQMETKYLENVADTLWSMQPYFFSQGLVLEIGNEELET
jgi:hypothetical protein